MCRYMSIYTRTGDSGQTSLFNGKRVKKSDKRIKLLGQLDELNSFIGLLMTAALPKEQQQECTYVQNLLFDIGAEIANPDSLPRVAKDYHNAARKLEYAIDSMDQNLSPLHNFILPGGSLSGAYAHICRTKTRTVERNFIIFAANHEINGSITIFLNRLSDYFFQLARYLNVISKIPDVLWEHKVD